MFAAPDLQGSQSWQRSWGFARWNCWNGNPFYVTEMLEAGWPSVPPTVRDVVAARLARLSPGTRRAVETAAVMGARVDLPLLSSAGEDLDECLATGILVADASGVRFRHELVRMAVEAAIPPYRQTELHVRLLAALEERGGADPAVLAHHAEGAQDEKAVLRHAPEAARRSAALGAHREAAAQYERALRFASERDRPGVAALQEGLAGEYALLDRWEETEAALRVALDLRRQLGDDLSLGEDLRLLSRAMWRLCRGGRRRSSRGRSGPDPRGLAARPGAGLGLCGPRRGPLRRGPAR
jgi:tetratricopeptide (TPR) repeat protein